MSAMKKYTRVNFQAYPDKTTPVSATNLNKMDKGIDDIDDEVVIVKDAITTINDKLSVTDVSSGFYFDTNTVKNTVLKAYRWGNVISVYAIYKPIVNMPENTPFLFSQTYDMASHIVGTGSAGSYWVGPTNHKVDVKPIGTRSANTQYYMYFTFITTTA